MMKVIYSYFYCKIINISLNYSVFFIHAEHAELEGGSLQKRKRACHTDSLFRQGDLYSVKYTVSGGIVETGV